MPSSYEKDYLCVFKIYKRVFSKFFTKSSPLLLFPVSKSSSAIFDVSRSSSSERYNYVKYFTSEETKMLVSKEELLSSGSIVFNGTVFIIMILTLFPFLLFSILSKKKYKYPLLVQEAIELSLLLSALKKNDIRKVHYFCIYERDSNLIAYVLMKNGIVVNKIPSEVPLFFWNRAIVANEISTCFGYQLDEIKAFKETMFIEKINSWAPENIMSAPKRFFRKGRNLVSGSDDIGYYSSGMWLRSILSVKFLGKDKVSDEHWLLSSLVEYCNTRSKKLIIYLHPIEKNKERSEMVKEHYQPFLKYDFVKLHDMNKASSEDLDKINLGISLYSTLMFERIYFGFKTLLVPLEMEGFPLEGTSIEKICVTKKNQLAKLIDDNLQLSINDFFVKNEIEVYSPFLK
ncbi:MAG: hypothetical protein AB7O73_01475 [Bacteroidia bacterium]